MNHIFFVFGLYTKLSCSFCNCFNGNITHLFCDCTITPCLWKRLQLKLKDNSTLLPLTPQDAAIFGFFEANCQSYLIQNHILLILKQYIYKSRKNKFLSSTCLLKEISKIKNMEKSCIRKWKKNIAYKRKRRKIEDKLP